MLLVKRNLIDRHAMAAYVGDETRLMVRMKDLRSGEVDTDHLPKELRAEVRDGFWVTLFAGLQRYDKGGKLHHVNYSNKNLKNHFTLTVVNR